MRSTFARQIVNVCIVTAAIVCVTRPVFAEENDRLFGVLPNYATVDGRPADDGSTMTSAISTRQSFRIAILFGSRRPGSDCTKA